MRALMKEKHTLTDSLTRQEKENSKLSERVQAAETELLSLKSSTKNANKGDSTLDPDVDVMQVSPFFESNSTSLFFVLLRNWFQQR